MITFIMMVMVMTKDPNFEKEDDEEEQEGDLNDLGGGDEDDDMEDIWEEPKTATFHTKFGPFFFLQGAMIGMLCGK